MIKKVVLLLPSLLLVANFLLSVAMYEFDFDCSQYRPLKNHYNGLLYASPKKALQQAITEQMNVSLGKQTLPAMVLVVELRKNDDNKYELTEVLDTFPFEDLSGVLIPDE